ncbi:MAG: hypothetical protein ACKOC8_08485 [Pirellulales bacterium]
MVAKFTISGIPALAALDRGKAAGANDPTVGLWEFLNTDRWIDLAGLRFREPRRGRCRSPRRAEAFPAGLQLER